jgi:hypothetical protein
MGTPGNLRMARMRNLPVVQMAPLASLMIHRVPYLSRAMAEEPNASCAGLTRASVDRTVLSDQ